MSEPKAVPPKEPEPNDAPQQQQTAGKTFCDLCGCEMYEWHCRIICQSCGYQRDCSDP